MDPNIQEVGRMMKEMEWVLWSIQMVIDMKVDGLTEKGIINNLQFLKIRQRYL